MADPTLTDRAMASCPSCLTILLAPDDAIVNHFDEHLIWAHGVSVDYLAACPTCDMTAGEHAYRERIMADSAAVYAQEVREFNARRKDGKT